MHIKHNHARKAIIDLIQHQLIQFFIERLHNTYTSNILNVNSLQEMVKSRRGNKTFGTAIPRLDLKEHPVIVIIRSMYGQLQDRNKCKLTRLGKNHVAIIAAK